MSKRAKITRGMQIAASDILTRFMFTKDMDDVISTWDEVYKDYELCDDPFTHTPCTPEEYEKNNLEYRRQVMMERYGHCDGL